MPSDWPGLVRFTNIVCKGGTSASCTVRFGLGWDSNPPIGFRFPVIPGIPGRFSDPRLILDEFPDLVGDRQIGPGPR